MKVLVTGGGGFLGGHLIRTLLNSDTEITVIDITRPNRQLMAHHYNRINWVQASVIMDDLSEHFVGIDAVYHLAGRALPGNSEDIFRELCKLNVNGTRNVARASVTAGVKRFIHISSAAVCGISNNMVLTENNCDPITSYGRSKLKSEQVVKEIAGGKMDFVILRPTAFFGEYHLGSLFEMTKAIKQKRYIMIGNGRNHLNFLYVKDLVDVMIRAVYEPSMTNQVYIVSDEPITLTELTNIIKKELDLPLTKFYIPEQVGLAIGFAFDIIANMFRRPMPLSVDRVLSMTHDYYFSSDKLMKGLSIKFNYGIYEGWARTIKWYRSEGLI